MLESHSVYWRLLLLLLYKGSTPPTSVHVTTMTRARHSNASVRRARIVNMASEMQAIKAIDTRPPACGAGLAG